ncbi:antibiotic biosynthesis monooxygenase family protein [Novosphingobium terrae]|uniref:antibiotic biosynthesis monooxygenase family protein n=1 Tax=Novosphingobium terrae TaxID=2726189 RepID=UPI00198167BD|nr:antibiotic biosynthesis monooxygenase [Novosphingobium terrae]
MVTEIARITIDPARSAEFEAAVAQAEPLFRAQQGCTGFALERVVETPEIYHLLVGWVSVEAHNVDFRSTEAFQQWRALAGPFFVSPPEVVHVGTVIGSVDVK